MMTEKKNEAKHLTEELWKKLDPIEKQIEAKKGAEDLWIILDPISSNDPNNSHFLLKKFCYGLAFQGRILDFLFSLEESKETVWNWQKIEEDRFILLKEEKTSPK